MDIQNNSPKKNASIKYISIGLIFMLFLVFNSYGQYHKQTEINEVVNVDSKEKNEIYENAKQWILSRFSTSDNLVEFDDENKNSINLTAHILMDKQKFVQGAMGTFVKTSDNTLTLKLRLDFKEGRYRYIISNMNYSFNQIGGPNEGYVQNRLNNITDLPKKKIKDVNEEADKKIAALISEMIANIADNKANKDDW